VKSNFGVCRRKFFSRDIVVLMLLTEKSAGQLRVVTVGGKRALSAGRAMPQQTPDGRGRIPKNPVSSSLRKTFPFTRSHLVM
jgi:hypothetical protein